MKWRVFVMCEKLLDFDKYIILDILHKLNRRKNRQMEQNEKLYGKASKAIPEQVGDTETYEMQILRKKFKTKNAQQEELFKVKFPVMLQVKFGDEVHKGDTNMIQKIVLCEKGEKFSDHLELKWKTDGNGDNMDTQPMYEIDRNNRDLSQQVLTHPILHYKLFEFFTDEMATIKCSEPPKVEDSLKGFGVQSHSAKISRKIKDYQLPLKKLQMLESIGPRQSLPPNTIVNRHMWMTEKRDDFLHAFFDSIKIEFRITIGDSWDNYIAKSAPDTYLKTLTRGKVFNRNSEVNQYYNVALHTDALKKFNLRVNIGLNMLSELSAHSYQKILPKVVELDGFKCIYTRVHTYDANNQYDEPLLDVEDNPEPLPMNWFKIARKSNLVRKTTQYEDPNIRKKLVKKVGQAGVVNWVLQLFNTETNEKLLEIHKGQTRPTDKEMLMLNPAELIQE